MNNVTETRYDLDITDFEGLDLDSMEALISAGNRWMMRNAALRSERELARVIAQVPVVLK